MDWNILLAEFKYSFSRSSRTGDQLIYIMETPVKLQFDFPKLKGLTPEDLKPKTNGMLKHI